MHFGGLLFLFLLILVTAPPCWSQASRGRRNRRPHIVLIVADDLGWSDVGWRDSEMYTPVLDRLARDGIVLNQTYMQVGLGVAAGGLLVFPSS